MFKSTRWVTVAVFKDSDNFDHYDLMLEGLTKVYHPPFQFIGKKGDPVQLWQVLMSLEEFNQQSDSIKALNKSIQKDSLTDRINNAIQGILDRVLLEDTLNKLELISSLLDDLVGMDTLKEYPAIESLIVDLYNALLDSDSPLNR
jgi:hypothetical protein